MKNKKIKIHEHQLKLINSDLVRESEWNFHVDKSGMGHDLSPYGSDSKYSMIGRETGHFGSGTYFSTYHGNDFSTNYGDLSTNFNPNFIEICDRVYRVDFDLYKNLYRVRSKRQGDILYTMCSELNHMYNKIVHMGRFDSRLANYSNSENYQIIRKNAEALGLRCPSYYELTRMAQRHDGVQSFSTLFMEWNGFNGVNVSGIDYYDNTKHGSVIYDLSKVSDKIRELDVNIPYNYSNRSYNNTIAYSLSDFSMMALDGESMFWQDKLNDMSINESLRILKNYAMSGKVLSSYYMERLNDALLKRYLSFLYVFSKSHFEVGRLHRDYYDGNNIRLNSWDDKCVLNYIYGDEKAHYARIINKCGAYYWANCIFNNDSMLIEMLNQFLINLSWDLSSDEELTVKKEFLGKVMSSMKRELTQREKNFIENDYYV